MKSNFTVITGILGFISTLFFLVILILEFASEFEREDQYWFFFIAFIGVFSVINYFIRTRFWNKKPSDISKLSSENILLKKQIEQEELKGKLKELTKN